MFKFGQCLQKYLVLNLRPSAAPWNSMHMISELLLYSGESKDCKSCGKHFDFTSVWLSFLVTLQIGADEMTAVCDVTCKQFMMDWKKKKFL